MTELLLRFVIGGMVVSLFSLVGDLFKPKSFAGLFCAAPSVALATLALTVHKDGRVFAAEESKAMLLGAVALGTYAFVVCRSLMHKRKAMKTALFAMPVWFGVAGVLWMVLLKP
jgi:hypothetical protein